MMEVPSVSACRPSHCWKCGVGQRRDDSRGLNLYGHGLRERTVLGALAVGEPAATHTLRVRRYLCRLCGAVTTVGPWDLLPGWLYSLVAVVLVLVRWACGEPVAALRAQLAGTPQHGFGEPGQWASLRRWARLAVSGQLFTGLSCSLTGTLRTRAERVVQNLADAAPPEGSTLERAVQGARRSVMAVAARPPPAQRPTS